MSSIRLPSFFVNESLVYLGDGRNNVAFFNGKLPHQTPITRVVLATARSLETNKVYHNNNQNTLPPLPSNRFFYHPDSGWSRDQPRPGSLFQRPREEEKRDPGNEVDRNCPISFVLPARCHISRCRLCQFEFQVSFYVCTITWCPEFSILYKLACESNLIHNTNARLQESSGCSLS